MNDDVDALPPVEAGLYHGSMRPFDSAQPFNAINAPIRRMLTMMGADTLVKVVAVNAEGTNPVGSVDVLPLVMQQTGDGHAVPHDVIYNVPYIRVQGGKTAIILDPQVGDIGAIMICGRDISGVKETRAASIRGHSACMIWRTPSILARCSIRARKFISNLRMTRSPYWRRG